LLALLKQSATSIATESRSNSKVVASISFSLKLAVWSAKNFKKKTKLVKNN
jgi:hypothetical protein